MQLSAPLVMARGADGSSWDHLNKEQNKRRQNRRKALKVLPGKPGELFLKITEITIELA